MASEPALENADSAQPTVPDLAWRDEDLLPEEDGPDATPPSAPLPSVRKARSAHFGSELVARVRVVPWWVISGAFHGLLVMLVTLLGVAVQRIQSQDTAFYTSLERPRVPELERLRHPDASLQSFEMLDDHRVLDNPVVPLRDADVVVNHDVSVTEEEWKAARGDARALSDVPLDGNGWVGHLGLRRGSGGAYGQRSALERRKLAEAGGGGRMTESAVQAGLRWLALSQEMDGRWNCEEFGGKPADVAVTGLALLAMLGAGNSERAGEYKESVRRAVRWLQSIQKPDGSLFKEGEIHGIGYHHAIAGLALVEAAGMGRVPETRVAAQNAVDYSCRIHQHVQNGLRMGWRYEAGEAGDLSVTGWFVMQLKAAKVAGLRVDGESIRGAERFLEHAQCRGDSPDGYDAHRYGYRDGTTRGVRQTAIGCLSRIFLGEQPKKVRAGIHWFVNLGGVPEWRNDGSTVDLYHWYYGTLCVFQYGGDLWKSWNQALITSLCVRQKTAGPDLGSWDPIGAFSSSWGRVGQTALSCLCLEVYYRYKR
ncbi:MAG: terpene cyclase/mutase family protein [Planctomycetes bacterium]|nr:terpene cyclase/mutase family protein [Planctomycetota bacterium]